MDRNGTEDRREAPFSPMKKRGRPPIAPEVSKLPASVVPAWVHDTVASEALRRDVSVAQVVRERLINGLKNRQDSQGSIT